MPEQNLPPDIAHAEPLVSVEERIKQRQQVFSALLEMLKPWLFELGNWIFGGLIAFNLIIVGAILTVGPSDLAIVIAVTMFASALPLNVTGLVVIKLIKDMSGVSIDEVMRKVFQEANIPIPENDTHGITTGTRNALYKKGIDTGLRYSLIIASISAILTALGIVAALWHMAWWVSVIFLIVSAISCVVIWIVFNTWRPVEPESAADQAMKDEVLKKYYQDQRNRK